MDSLSYLSYFCMWTQNFKRMSPTSVRSKTPVNRRRVLIVLVDLLRLRHCPFSCKCQWTQQCRCFSGWTGRQGVERSLCRLLAQVSCCLCPLVSAVVSAQTSWPLWWRSGKSLHSTADGCLFKEGLSAAACVTTTKSTKVTATTG